MSNKIESGFKRLVKLYVSYDESVWRKMHHNKYLLTLDVVGSDLDPHLKLKVLKALDFECVFDEKHQRYDIEKGLQNTAKLLGFYDEWIFNSIDCYDQHSAQNAVLELW